MLGLLQEMQATQARRDHGLRVGLQALFLLAYTSLKMLQSCAHAGGARCKMARSIPHDSLSFTVCNRTALG